MRVDSSLNEIFLNSLLYLTSFVIKKSIINLILIIIGGIFMSQAGNSYIIGLKQAHLQWGTYRHTNSRGNVYGEGYLPIPRPIATNFDVYNSNQTGAAIIYNCNSADGFLQNATIKASGSSQAGDPYAKQFQGNGNLKLIGQWFSHVNAQIGDRVRISWISPTDIEIELI